MITTYVHQVVDVKMVCDQRQDCDGVDYWVFNICTEDVNGHRSETQIFMNKKCNLETIYEDNID